METNTKQLSKSADDVKEAVNMNKSILASVEESLKKEVESLPPSVQQFINLDKRVKLEDGKFYSWQDMLSPKAVSLNKLRSRLITLNQIINNLEEGYNSPIHFVHTTQDEIVEFTWEDTKEIIKCAIDKRTKTVEYQKLNSQYQKALAENPRDIQLIARLYKSL